MNYSRNYAEQEEEIRYNIEQIIGRIMGCIVNDRALRPDQYEIRTLENICRDPRFFDDIHRESIVRDPSGEVFDGQRAADFVERILVGALEERRHKSRFDRDDRRGFDRDRSYSGSYSERNRGYSFSRNSGSRYERRSEAGDIFGIGDRTEHERLVTRNERPAPRDTRRNDECGNVQQVINPLVQKMLRIKKKYEHPLSLTENPCHSTDGVEVISAGTVRSTAEGIDQTDIVILPDVYTREQAIAIAEKEIPSAFISGTYSVGLMYNQLDFVKVTDGTAPSVRTKLDEIITKFNLCKSYPDFVRTVLPLLISFPSESIKQLLLNEFNEHLTRYFVSAEDPTRCTRLRVWEQAALLENGNHPSTREIVTHNQNYLQILWAVINGVITTVLVDITHDENTGPITHSRVYGGNASIDFLVNHPKLPLLINGKLARNSIDKESDRVNVETILRNDYIFFRRQVSDMIVSEKLTTFAPRDVTVIDRECGETISQSVFSTTIVEMMVAHIANSCTYAYTLVSRTSAGLELRKLTVIPATSSIAIISLTI